MSEIAQSNGICTQITTVKLPNGNQDEVLNLMKERARFMATQPGFISVNLHRSDKLAAAHHSPEFREKWPQFGDLVREIEPCLYDVVHVESA